MTVAADMPRPGKADRATRRRAALAFVATLPLMLCLGWEGKHLGQTPIGTFEHPWTVGQAESILTYWREAGAIGWAWLQILGDFPLIIAYATFLFFLAQHARSVAANRGHWRRAALARRAGHAALLGAVFDVLEDVGMLGMLLGQMDPALVFATSVACLLKWSLIFLSIGGSVFAWPARPGIGAGAALLVAGAGIRILLTCLPPS